MTSSLRQLVSARLPLVPASFPAKSRPISTKQNVSSGPVVYNSLTGGNVPLLLPESVPPRLTWYNCGPTVYDSAHLGHARTYVTLDTLRRVATNHFGIQILAAMGMTDVDDKIINRAAERKMDPLELARGFEAEFWEDMTALNVAPPVVQTRVTEHIPAIVSYVKQLEKNGYAYAAPDGVYFDTTAFGARGHTYGKMANVTTADPEAEDDATPAGMKRNPKDFALWKLSKGSGGMVWPSPWGSGRPGWHIECSAMTHAIFGSKLDVHGGGVDLKFPHHCNEIAQCEGHGDCDQWARIFLHTGHLHISGRKMSKSLKNFVTIRELLKDGPAFGNNVADVFRMFCLQYHYRSNISYSPDRMHEAASLIQRLKSVESLLATRATHHQGSSWGDPEKMLYTEVSDVIVRIRQSLLIDFYTPGAVLALLDLASAGQKYAASVLTPSVHLLQTVVDVINNTMTSFGMTSFGHRTSPTGAGVDVTSVQAAFVKFRDDVRQVSVAAIKGKTPDCAQKVLGLCDDARSNVFPKIGIVAGDSGTKESTK